MKGNKYVLIVIVVSQFCCTSLWFASNGIMSDLIESFSLSSSALGHLTSAVQLGFICGTLMYAIYTIADRHSPSKVFLLSALLGAGFNLLLIWKGNNMISIICFRFLTGFFLAGIYPVGMKIAADYFEKGLGKSLGYLVGALVIGTALPHLLKDLTQNFAWEIIIITVSTLAILGGLLMFLCVPDGPFRKASIGFNSKAIIHVFRNRNFRKSAFGYFGHMWELYALWAFIPVILQSYKNMHNTEFNISLLSFAIIAMGGIACVIGGFVSESKGVKKTARFALFSSCLCCLVSPLVMNNPSGLLFLSFMFFWGMVVIADSPLFSTLVAQNANQDIKGTALTIVNCIGFSITIISIQLITMLQSSWNTNYIYTVLAIGPVLGLFALGRTKRNSVL